jgi:hypothetical protein
MHIADEDLDFYVRGHTTESASALVASHAESCGDCRRKLNETREFIRQLADLSKRQGFYDAEENRREPRIPTNDGGSLKATDPLVLDRQKVTILDVSKSGLKLFTADYFQVGTVVQVHLKETFILGEVRYCNAVSGGFRVRVQIQSVS